MTRILVDASTLIALARIGELSGLRDLAGTAHATTAVLAEASRSKYPDSAPVDAARREGWLVEVRSRTASADPAYGMGPGEASLFEAWAPGDLLVVDDGDARRLAQARSIPFTGLLGLLVGGAREGLVQRDRSLQVLEGLARSRFRMTADLYAWARRELETPPNAGGHAPKPV